MNEIEKIHDWLKQAKAMVICAGAGMGADSGLPVFRGDDGQWGNLEAEQGKNIFEISNPDALMKNPEALWQQFAKRTLEFATAAPHNGFYILRKWIAKFQLDYFILTSNVDEQFEMAGFEEEKIRELHGSIFYLQCTQPCSNMVWRHIFNFDKLENNIAEGDFPLCPNCGALARPNIYMFRDGSYIPERSDRQKRQFNKFLERYKNNEIVVFEIGSGPHVQSIRQKTRMLISDYGAKVIRINPNDFKIKEPHIGINEKALKALEEIDSNINK